MKKIYTDLRKPCSQKFEECPWMTQEERKDFAGQRARWKRDRKARRKRRQEERDERDRKYKEILAAGPRVAKICRPCEKLAQERYSKRMGLG